MGDADRLSGRHDRRTPRVPIDRGGIRRLASRFDARGRRRGRRAPAGHADERSHEDQPGPSAVHAPPRRRRCIGPRRHHRVVASAWRRRTRRVRRDAERLQHRPRRRGPRRDRHHGHAGRDRRPGTRGAHAGRTGLPRGRHRRTFPRGALQMERPRVRRRRYRLHGRTRSGDRRARRRRRTAVGRAAHRRDHAGRTRRPRHAPPRSRAAAPRSRARARDHLIAGRPRLGGGVGQAGVHRSGRGDRRAHPRASSDGWSGSAPKGVAPPAPDARYSSTDPPSARSPVAISRRCSGTASPWGSSQHTSTPAPT